MSEWAQAFLVTLAVELPLYAGLLRPAAFPGSSSMAWGLRANALSHPLFWFAFPRFSPYAAFFVVGEAASVAIEATLLVVAARRMRLTVRVPQIVVAALAANAASAAVGLGLVAASRP